MKQPRLRQDYSRLTDAALELKAETVSLAMNANPVFPTPTPSTAEFLVAINAYSTALTAAQSRDKVEVAEKNAKRATLEQLMSSLAGYVMSVANGDEAILVLSGFDLVKPASPQPPIGIPENFSVSRGINEGEIVSSVDRVAGARTYIHEYTADPLTPASEWAQQFTTVRKCTIADLVPGQKYWFRVAAIGTRNQMVYTNVQLLMVA